MRYATKGALLSGLVFPGLGQIMLKRYARGAALMLAFSAGLAVLVLAAVRQALAIIEKAGLDRGIVDISTISKAVTEASEPARNRSLHLVSLLVVACWIFSALDAYRIGRKRELDASRMP